jgi:glycosyltransferase involved in cell wall biosynthesis
VHRIPVLARGKGGKKLLLNYLSYLVSGIFYFPRMLKGKQFDVIFVYVPSPITSVIPAMYLKWRLKSHLAVWVQDLWPESVQATGYVKNKFILRLIGRMVKWIYSVSDTLLVQSRPFTQFMKKYVAEDKIIYYPNSYLEAKESFEAEDSIPESLLSVLKNNHCFVFAGNLGSAQSLDTIIQAAQMLTHLTDCKILLIGSGSKDADLKKQIKDKNLENIILPGRFNPDCMPIIFSKATGLLVTLKSEEIFSYTIPSKIQSYLAAGKPILAALDGEGARVVKEAKAGLTSPAEDSSALVKNIEQLYHMAFAERDILGQSGRAYFLEHFEMVKQSKRLVEILQARIC